MNLASLAFKNAKHDRFRSLVVVLCVALVAGLVLAATAVMQGAAASLHLGWQRLGADAVVIAEEGEGLAGETALLTGAVTALLPPAKVQEVAQVPGVGAVSPQLYLGRLRLPSLPALPEVSLVAFDPASDFAVQPWLRQRPAAPLGPGEAIGGSAVALPTGTGRLPIDGYELVLVGNLEPTGNTLDETLFVSFATARALAEALGHAEPPLTVPDGVSAILVRAEPAADRRLLAPRILQMVPGVTPVESAGVFRALQRQLAGLSQGALALLAMTWALTVGIVGLVFSLAAGERRREIAVLRALGSSVRFVLAMLVAEAAMLALLGGVLGTGLASGGIYLWGEALAGWLGIPYLGLPASELLRLAGAGLAVAFLSGTAAVLWPALRVSREEPASAMRE